MYMQSSFFPIACCTVLHSQLINPQTSQLCTSQQCTDRFNVLGFGRLRFRLDDTGLFPATQGSGGKRGAKGSASLKFYTEREVFDFLGFPWLEPHERNL
ncbi:hypothetical protein RIF29_36219 [Crotalaria pallida]|uniref:DNA polymerase beta thumb domain-containing protein n=1 Tax=Crotalaria pallida TaxID=3830 RepID=A0AAN9EAV1_CROPI